MLKTRLIPVLLLQNGLLVRSEGFTIHQVIGDPLHEVRRFNDWNVDELIYLDISREDHQAPQRRDHKVSGLIDTITILETISKTCFMPLTWGGRLSTLEDMHQRFSLGADKIAINTMAVRAPELIGAAARRYGSQAIVVSIDVMRHADGLTEVYIDGGRTPTGLTPQGWAQEAADRGAGEVLLQSIDRDGAGHGYDLDLISAVSSCTTVPVIACGGVGRFEDYADGIRAGASAVAAANLWHFKELSDRAGKRAMAKAGIPVRL